MTLTNRTPPTKSIEVTPQSLPVTFDQLLKGQDRVEQELVMVTTQSTLIDGVLVARSGPLTHHRSPHSKKSKTKVEDEEENKIAPVEILTPYEKHMSKKEKKLAKKMAKKDSNKIILKKNSNKFGRSTLKEIDDVVTKNLKKEYKHHPNEISVTLSEKEQIQLDLMREVMIRGLPTKPDPDVQYPPFEPLFIDPKWKGHKVPKTLIGMEEETVRALLNSIHKTLTHQLTSATRYATDPMKDSKTKGFMAKNIGKKINCDLQELMRRLNEIMHSHWNILERGRYMLCDFLILIYSEKTQTIEHCVRRGRVPENPYGNWDKNRLCAPPLADDYLVSPQEGFEPIFHIGKVRNKFFWFSEEDHKPEKFKFSAARLKGCIKSQITEKNMTPTEVVRYFKPLLTIEMPCAEKYCWYYRFIHKEWFYYHCDDDDVWRRHFFRHLHIIHDRLITFIHQYASQQSLTELERENMKKQRAEAFAEVMRSPEIQELFADGWEREEICDKIYMDQTLVLDDRERNSLFFAYKKTINLKSTQRDIANSRLDKYDEVYQEDYVLEPLRYKDVAKVYTSQKRFDVPDEDGFIVARHTFRGNVVRAKRIVPMAKCVYANEVELQCGIHSTIGECTAQIGVTVKATLLILTYSLATLSVILGIVYAIMRKTDLGQTLLEELSLVIHTARNVREVVEVARPRVAQIVNQYEQAAEERQQDVGINYGRLLEQLVTGHISYAEQVKLLEIKSSIHIMYHFYNGNYSAALEWATNYGITRPREILMVLRSAGFKAALVAAVPIIVYQGVKLAVTHETFDILCRSYDQGIKVDPRDLPGTTTANYELHAGNGDFSDMFGHFLAPFFSEDVNQVSPMVLRDLNTQFQYMKHVRSDLSSKVKVTMDFLGAISRTLFGIDLTDPASHFYPLKLMEVCKFVNTIKESGEAYLADPQICTKITEVYKEANELRLSPRHQMLPSFITHYFNKQFEELRDYNVRAEQQLTGALKRCEPLGVFFLGTAGVGKSVAEDYLMQAISYLDGDQYSRMNAYSYNVDDPYFEGYAKQKFCFIDDMFATTDVAMRQKEALQIIHMINNVPYNLCMAFGQKGANFFDSDYVFMSTNLGAQEGGGYKHVNWDDLGLSCKDAFCRRLHIVLWRDKKYEGEQENTMFRVERCIFDEQLEGQYISAKDLAPRLRVWHHCQRLRSVTDIYHAEKFAELYPPGMHIEVEEKWLVPHLRIDPAHNRRVEVPVVLQSGPDLCPVDKDVDSTLRLMQPGLLLPEDFLLLVMRKFPELTYDERWEAMMNHLEFTCQNLQDQIKTRVRFKDWILDDGELHAQVWSALYDVLVREDLAVCKLKGGTPPTITTRLSFKKVDYTNPIWKGKPAWTFTDPTVDGEINEQWKEHKKLIDDQKGGFKFPTLEEMNIYLTGALKEYFEWWYEISLPMCDYLGISPETLFYRAKIVMLILALVSSVALLCTFFGFETESKVNKPKSLKELSRHSNTNKGRLKAAKIRRMKRLREGPARTWKTLQAGDPNFGSSCEKLLRSTIYLIAQGVIDGEPAKCRNAIGFHVKNGYIFTVRHFIDEFLEYDDVHLYAYWGGFDPKQKRPRFVVELNYDDIWSFEDADISVLKLPDKVSLPPSTYDYLADPSKDLIVYEGMQASILSATEDGVGTYKPGIYVRGPLTSNYSFCGQSMVVEHPHYYRSATQGGDSGSMLVIPGDQGRPVIVGMHIGINFGFTSTHCLGFPIDKHLIDGFFEDLSEPVIQSSEHLPLIVCGIADPPSVTMNRSKIRRSEFHGWCGRPTFVPTHLKPFHNADGELVNPLHVAMKKLRQTRFDVEPYDEDRVMDYFAKLYPRSGCPQVRSINEAVNGNGRVKLPTINHSTSAGYPWSLLPDKKKKGKGHFMVQIENGEYELTTEMYNHIKTVQDKLFQGENMSVIWADVLKDETRPIEKVNKGKTRLFSTCPIDYLILIRMYFLDFIEYVQSRCVDRPVSVGINPHSIEWHEIALRMCKFDGSLVAGDFENFDGNLTNEMGRTILKFINWWYNDGDDNARIRGLLLEHVFKSRRVYGRDIYETVSGTPSGHPLTAIFNSFHCIGMTFVVLTEDLNITAPDFDMVCYGDDNVININCKGIRCSTLAEHYKRRFGIGYTHFSKDAVDRDDTIHTIRYLGREFKFDQGHCRAPLDLATIKEMLFWHHGNEHSDAKLYSTVESFAIEMSHHGREVFLENTQALRDWVSVNAPRHRRQVEEKIQPYSYYFDGMYDPNRRVDFKWSF